MAHGEDPKLKPSTILPPAPDDSANKAEDFEVSQADYDIVMNQRSAVQAALTNVDMAPWLKRKDKGRYEKGTIVGDVEPEDMILSETDRYGAYAQIKEMQRTRAAEAKAGMDELSGLGNRRSFDEKFKIEFKRAERYKTPFSLIVVDIDHFKRVNDLLGHQAGDEAIKVVAGILESLRETDTAYRYGGEEFTLILPETNNRQATKVAEKIRKEVEIKLKKYLIAEYGEKATQIAGTISVGLATYSAQKTPDELFKQADDALYRAKQTGRNQVINASHMSSASLQTFEAVAVSSDLDHVKKMEDLLPQDPEQRKKMVELFIQRNAR